MADITDPDEIARQYKNARFSGRSPMFSDLPLGTVITEEMRAERLRNPLRFPYRKFSCPVCQLSMDYAGTRPLYTREGTALSFEDKESVQYLFTCRGCNANLEYIPLKD